MPIVSMNKKNQEDKNLRVNVETYQKTHSDLSSRTAR
jgi:hypothetical protein